MHEKLPIDKVLITLEVGEKTCLFILLGKHVLFNLLRQMRLFALSNNWLTS